MRVENKSLLDEFRARGRCEWCSRARTTRPHHIVHRGMGGGRTLEIRPNLIALCDLCHDLYHSTGDILQADLQAIAARREGVLQRDLEAVVLWFLKLPRSPLPCQVEAALGQLGKAAKELAKKVAKEAGLDF